MAVEKFYVIKLVNCANETGWVVSYESKAGFAIALGLTSTIKQFDSFGSAEVFIRKNKLKANRTKAYILSNDDLVNYYKNDPSMEKFSEAPPMFYIQNKDGQKMYNTGPGQYKFKHGDTGYCVWEEKDEAEIREALKNYKIEIVYVDKKPKQ